MARPFQKNKTNNYCVLSENYFSGFCNSFFLKISKKRCSFANHSTKIELKNGVWRSWLACLHGVQEVGSSSLLTPTI